MSTPHCLDCGTALDAAHACAYRPPGWTSDPRVTERFDILKRLGHGGMGETFLAVHRVLHAQRALKSTLARERSADLIARFQVEAQNALKVNHPNVARVFDCLICADGTPVAEWDFIDGVTLRQRLDSGPMPVGLALSLAVQVLEGLEAIHRHMVHRDIKPENLMLTGSAEAVSLKIIDFGLAKTFASTTVSTSLIGTAPYVAPEGWDVTSPQRVLPTVDIFAAGAVVYEMLTGSVAFGGAGVHVLGKMMNGEPAWIGPLSSHLPSALPLQAIIRRALARMPADRYQTAAEFRVDLQRVARQYDGVLQAIDLTPALPLAAVKSEPSAVVRLFRRRSTVSQYRAWKHPSGLTESVKQGWSWPAFLFGFLWALTKRMTLLGIGMLLGAFAIGWAIGWAIEATQVDVDDDTLFLVVTLLLGLFFGANGNSWRERHLVARGFAPVATTVRAPVLVLLAHRIIAGVSALWRASVWSKVIAGIILVAVVAGGAYFLLLPSVAERQYRAAMASPHVTAPRCTQVTLLGHVEPNGAETFSWFEWGETPDLGRVTSKQRFTEETHLYQNLVGLNESTTYFYRLMAVNKNGRREGRVLSFTTARCER